MKRSTLIAGVVFLVLLIGTVLALRQKPERGISRLAVSALQKDQVTRLVFSGKNPGELRKDGDVWRIASGKEADSAAVGRLLDSLTKMQSSDLITHDTKRHAELELDAEKGTKLEVYGGAKKLSELWVGKNVTGGVAMRTGGDVFKVSGTSQTVFVRPQNSWIERRVFSDKVDQAVRLDVALAGSTPYALVKKDNAYNIEDSKVLPAGFRFDADAARAVVTSMANLRAKDFEDKDPGVEVTGLGDNADTLRLSLTKPQDDKKDEKAAEGSDKKDVAKAAVTPAVEIVATRVLRLGKEKGEQKDVYAKVDGRDDVFTLSASTAKGLRRAATDLRNMKLMSFDVAKATKLALRDGKVEVSFEKVKGVWQLKKSAEPKPADFELDANAVERRLGSVLGARALSIADAKMASSSGLGAPVASAVVTLEGGATATLALGKDTKDGDKEVVFAKGNADTATYLVAKWTRQSLFGGLATFKKQPESNDDGLANIDPKALNNLPPEVRASLLQQIQDKQKQRQIMQQLEAKARPAAAAKAKAR